MRHFKKGSPKKIFDMPLPNFVQGMAKIFTSIVDFGNYDKYDKFFERNADISAMKNDWSSVGSNIASSMIGFHKENECLLKEANVSETQEFLKTLQKE